MEKPYEHNLSFIDSRAQESSDESANPNPECPGFQVPTTQLQLPSQLNSKQTYSTASIIAAHQ
jgi:hypothetical protein